MKTGNIHEDWKSLTDLYQTQLQSHNFYLNIMEH